jgi:nucleoside-diphosphate-sugar epimerase/SAM-dependent methyltransferase
MRVLITGSSGLVGSELVSFFDKQAQAVIGIDNNMRSDFFGREGDTTWNLRRLTLSTRHFRPLNYDIRNREALSLLFKNEGPFDLVVHCAAQPSHDLAARRPLDDFDVNAVGTINLLESIRQFSPEAVFVFMSTNKVYGDAPNELPIVELPTRYDYARPEDFDGISEEMRLDRSKHSIFGASKVAADIMTQEYGKYYGLRTVCLRGGCLTGPHHSGVELHGFLSYLVKAHLEGRTYRIYGYKGKQVRDNIHSYDIACLINAIYENPRAGEVYNLGGGRENSCSILEAFEKIAALSGQEAKYEYVDQNREGDHICYISNLCKLKAHYPHWELTKSLDHIFEEIFRAWCDRLKLASPPQQHSSTRMSDSLVGLLAERERQREQYWQKRDPILADRLLWRAQTLRHMVHLLPGQTILELGCGTGQFTQALLHVSRGENPITAVSFGDVSGPKEIPNAIEYLPLDSFPGHLEQRQFDFIVVMDLLDQRNCSWFLQSVYALLKPGGEVIFYESNPWNPLLRLRRLLGALLGHADPRRLLNHLQLYELISEIGFIRSFAIFNDFVYAPLTPSLVWPLRNLSILMENAPGIHRLAGSILIHAQKPPRVVEKRQFSLCKHEQLRGAVSVVIPCHNEEMNIGPLVDGLRAYYDAYIHEIIPIDDNSTDRTREVIESLTKDEPRMKPVFRTGPNGVGRALTDGYRVATGQFVLSMDCDFQHLLPELRDLFDAAADGFDVVVGSRFSRHSVLLNYPLMKIVANRSFHALAQLLLLRRFHDLTNNLKLMSNDVLTKLQLTQPGFAVNAETGLQPLIMGYKVKEVPISWINRTPDMGISSFRLMRVGGGYWRVLLGLWAKCVFGTGPYSYLTSIRGVRSTVRDWEGIPYLPITDQTRGNL